MKALTIGIAGGSGSGKTTISHRLSEGVGADRISFLEMDAYYRDLSHLPVAERAKQNFDHPSAYDLDLFIEHLTMLCAGEAISRPVYDFTIHSRSPKTVRVEAHPVVIVEGILLYENPRVRELIDIKAFVDTPADYRFIRRLLRDIQERGRSTESVVDQYHRTVRPMHMAFVEPTREHADIIIPWQGYNDVAVEMLIARTEAVLTDRIAASDIVLPKGSADIRLKARQGQLD